jgi:hypothetical protein
MPSTADALEHVTRQVPALLLLPLEEGGGRRAAEQRTLLRDTQAPADGDAEKGAQRGRGQLAW